MNRRLGISVFFMTLGFALSLALGACQKKGPDQPPQVDEAAAKARHMEEAAPDARPAVSSTIPLEDSLASESSPSLTEVEISASTKRSVQ